MKTTEQIAADCGMLPKIGEILKRALDDEHFPHTEMEDDLCEIVGALYRRIEKLEDELKTLGTACDKFRTADGQLRTRIKELEVNVMPVPSTATDLRQLVCDMIDGFEEGMRNCESDARGDVDGAEAVYDEYCDILDRAIAARDSIEESNTAAVEPPTPAQIAANCGLIKSDMDLIDECFNDEDRWPENGRISRLHAVVRLLYRRVVTLETEK